MGGKLAVERQAHDEVGPELGEKRKSVLVVKQLVDACRWEKELVGIGVERQDDAGNPTATGVLDSCLKKVTVSAMDSIEGANGAHSITDETLV